VFRVERIGRLAMGKLSMNIGRRKGKFTALLLSILPGSAMISPVEAYVDPGTTGLISQLLYVLFYGALGVFFFCFRYIKELVANGRAYLAKIFSRRTDSRDSAPRS